MILLGYWSSPAGHRLDGMCATNNLSVSAVPETTTMIWATGRPELAVCTPQQLMEDMRQFLQARRGKQLQSSTFPEAILNGAQLDLNALYRAVCSRGGYAMGSGVNWAGQVSNCCCC